jgi:iron complex outermembrane receptor protein
MNYTVDFYRIEVADRTFAISTQDVSSDPESGDAYANFLALSDAGVAGAESIGGVFYFANAFDTVTSGMDIVVTTPFDWDNGSVTDLTASINYNKTEFDSDPSEFLSRAEDRYDFENDVPEWRGVITARHTIDALSFVARANYYGDYSDSNGSTDIDIQDHDALVMFDLEGSYRFNDTFRVTLGGRNIFDEYPDEVDQGINDYCCGRVYSSNTIVPWQGGYYFMRLDADF